MGNEQSCNKINFEDVQEVIVNNYAIMISTLPLHRQDCLIKGTKSTNDEVETLNTALENNTNTLIVIYGESSCDNSVYTKYKQLLNHGFNNVYIYSGGLFEWLLLQDIYGSDLFQTTSHELDLLKYKGKKIWGVKMIEH